MAIQHPSTLLPSWTGARVDSTDLAYTILNPLYRDLSRLDDLIASTTLWRYCSTVTLGLDRIRWATRYPWGSDEDATAVWTAGSLSGTIRRAATYFDYLTAQDPVWRITSEGSAEARNLWQRGSTLTGTGTYTLTSETSGLVEDGRIYWQDSQSIWRWLEADDSAVTGTASGAAFTVPNTGSLSVWVASQRYAAALLSTGTITFTRYQGGTAPLDFSIVLVENPLDHHGLYYGLPRLKQESNLDYRTRLTVAAQHPSSTSIADASLKVATQLGLIGTIAWDGVTSLTLDSGNVSGIWWVWVDGLDLFTTKTEILTDTGDHLNFRAAHPGWRPNSFITSDGAAVRGYTVSGNLVTMSSSVTGTVQAHYGVSGYAVAYNASGHVTGLTSTTGSVSGSYRVVWARRVTAHSPALPSYLKATLLDGAGLPTLRYRQLMAALREGDTTLASQARWDAASWLDDIDQPEIISFTVPLDLNRSA